MREIIMPNNAPINNKQLRQHNNQLHINPTLLHNKIPEILYFDQIHLLEVKFEDEDLVELRDENRVD
jgi:hypothetical protein